MNRAEIVGGISKAWSFSKAMGLGEVFSNPAPLFASPEFVALSLAEDVRYEELYLAGLERGDFNIVLTDYSYLQFGLSKDNHTRFAYYPNPFIGASREAVAELTELREYVEEGLLTIEEYMHRISDQRQKIHAPMLRYENAPEQYIEHRHPCSHFHFGHHSDNRWAVRRSLTPLTFTMLILRQFYSESWMATDNLSLFEREGSPDSYLEFDRQNCRILPDEFFSPAEQRLYHFT